MEMAPDFNTGESGFDEELTSDPQRPLIAIRIDRLNACDDAGFGNQVGAIFVHFSTPISVARSAEHAG